MSKTTKHLIAHINGKEKRRRKKREKGEKQQASSVHPSYPDHTEEANSRVPSAAATLDVIATESHVVPYDEDLLERIRTQWQFGDWESLSKLDCDTLKHHPDRAKLVLLAAAGQQQQGETDTARRLIRLAQNWGCSKRLVSQIMVAGVYNTLGRAAAAIGETPRMLQHFESALATGAPGGDVRLLTQVRISQQLAQLGLPGGVGTLQAGCTNASLPQAVSIGKAVQTMAEQLKVQSAEITAQMKKQDTDIANVRKALEITVKKEILNATMQIEAFLGVQSYINGGEVLPSMHGWPISPDFALYLIELIENNDYDLVIEFGSGTSTVLIAKTLAKAAGFRQGKLPARQIAFEHLEEYQKKTLFALQKTGLADSVQLELAPLVPYAASDGNIYRYYACHETLSRLAKSLPRGVRILVMVDGPPGATGKHARYPALPVVYKHFSGARIDLLLDDYIRADEKEVAQLWLHDLESCGLVGSLVEKRMEKDACFLSILDSEVR